MLDGLLQDLSFAARVLLKRPWGTVAMIVALALGIGANVAIFSVADALYFEPLPLETPDRLVSLERVFRGGSTRGPQPNVSIRQFVHWQDSAVGLESVSGYLFLPTGVNLIEGTEPEHLRAARVLASFFTTLDAHPALGRVFQPADGVVGAPPVVVLSHRLWADRFESDPDIAGRLLQIDGQAHEVVGVMPPDFRFPEYAQIWVAMPIDRASTDRRAILAAFGRLEPGMSPEVVGAAMAGPASEYVERHGNSKHKEAFLVSSLRRSLNRAVDADLAKLFGSVLVVLLVACVNVVNLQLARLSRRRREMATRLALGAPPRRLLRQLLIESLLLSALGTGAGLLLSRWLVPLVLAVIPSSVQQFNDISLDVTVLAFTATVAVLVAVGTGLIPGISAFRTQVGASRNRLGTTGRRRRGRLLLIVAEVALTTLLLLVAMLLYRSYEAISKADPGFDSSRILTLRLPLSSTDYGTTESWHQLCHNLVPDLRQLPGIANAAAVTNLPMDDGPDLSFLIVGRDPEVDGEGAAQYLGISPGYFETLDIPLVRGRVFDDDDHNAKSGVVIINETMARHFWSWPEGDPVGQRIHIGMPSMVEIADPEPRTIIGIVADIYEEGVDFAPPDMLYVPLPQVPDATAAFFAGMMPMSLMLEIDDRPEVLLPLLQERIRRFDGDLPITRIVMLDEVVASQIGTRGSTMRLVILFAALTFVLAVMGIYAVFAYLVAVRVQEIGLRMALGADRRKIMWLILRQGLLTAGAGVGFGVVVSLGVGRLIASSLYGISPVDLVTYIAVPMILLAVAVLALFPLAWRAARIEPMQAICYD